MMKSDIPNDSEILQRNRMFSAYQALKKQGWNDIIYCPKDGSVFLVIEAGSTGVHECIYEGTWPDGKWWILENGDMYPSMPILWRAK